jgi:hypothetical protein
MRRGKKGMFNPAFAKYFVLWVVIGVLLIGILLLVRQAVGNNMTLQVLTLTIGLAAILALLIGFNELKKRL